MNVNTTTVLLLVTTNTLRLRMRQVVRSWLYSCVLSYRHPGVRQDLVGSETSVYVDLQHLTNQHLRSGAGRVIVNSQ